MNIATFNSLDIKKFEKFCYELFSLEKLAQVLYDDHKKKLNILILEVNNENDIEKKESLTSSDLQMNFLNEIKDIWENIEKTVKEYISSNQIFSNYLDQRKIIDIQYAMTSLADEIFLKKNEVISKYWRDNLLEYHFFGTRSSGSSLFEKIETILVNKDRQLIDLAYIYFVTLNLGFKGKYSNSLNNEDLKNYKKRLYNFIFPLDEIKVDEENLKFSNSLCLPVNFKESFLPNVKKWYYYILLCFILYFILSTIIWFYMNSSLSKKLEEMNQILYEIEK